MEVEIEESTNRLAELPNFGPTPSANAEATTTAPAPAPSIADALLATADQVVAEAESKPTAPPPAINLDEAVPDVKTVDGKLVAHGKAPLHNEPGAPESYYVTLATEKGHVVVWGEDLNRAMSERAFKAGEPLRLHCAGSVPVTMKIPERDSEGRVTGEKTVRAMRNAWGVTALPPTLEAKATKAERAPLLPTSPDAAEQRQHEELMAVVNSLLKGAGAAPPRHGVIPAGPVSSVPLAEGQVRTGVAATIRGAAATLAEAVGGAMGVAGAAGSGAVKAAGSIAKEAAAQVRGMTVLPRLSEYRVSQVEKHATAYAEAQEQMWNATPRLLALRTEIAERARVTGASVEDVVNKMRPGGEFADIGKRFCEAVSESPDAISHKKTMEKALDAFGRQYEVALEEQLNPETSNSQVQSSLSGRIDDARLAIENSAGSVPPFPNPAGGVEPSHADRLREALTRVVEKIKEIARQIGAVFRGQRAEAEADSPSP